ncbi:MAG: hypothetical protein LBM61_03265 [Prevotellaceae bacterium]|jgi:hypothetical protein|nr:hypothetical protein [Prevotellaceae bacterium]
MKKNLFLGGLLVLGLLAACTQIEQPPTGGESGDLVTLTVQREADPVTRAEPVVPDGYKLRYILEIRDKAATTPRPTQRFEQDNGSFAFILDEGTYDFLLWADYIPEAAELSKAKYPDKYYDTQDLTKVSRTTAVPDSIAECIAMDAFFGSIIDRDKEANVDLELSVTLKRPFARITLIQKPLSLLATVRAVGFSYEEGYQAFNIQKGDTVYAPAKKDTLTLTNNGEVFQMAEGGIFAYAYLFAPADGGAETKSVINVSFYGDEEAENKIGNTFALPAEQPYMRNYVTNITENYLDPTGDLDVDHNPDYETALTDEEAISILEAARLVASEADAMANTFSLDTSEELFALAHAVNNGLTMPADIVAAEYAYAGAVYYLGADIDLEDEPWTPIGDSETVPFTGAFAGMDLESNSYQITGLNVEHASYAAGLFGYCTGMLIMLQVDGKIRTADEIAYAGGIVGRYESSWMTYCSFSGTVETAATVAAGGLAGTVISPDGLVLSNVSLATTVTAAATASVAPLVGLWNNGNGYVGDFCAWLNATTTEADEAGNKGYATLEELLDPAAIALLNNGEVTTTDGLIVQWANVDGELKLVAVPRPD